ncbi:signal transduction histidine kinase [Allocatelliglobosispora scoriae]|uniref:histidine kinase n=1 Tax=Allocatelliglobosispora scoriae TaxID=643052 RepID=A0A841BWF2_9ACTN|nr:ATP-binding protein [Allocatelliglobosispora scoriae]MBB5873437.1 signal transduction histidine kinase [Allocatelliglobosispora scoriae]
MITRELLRSHISVEQDVFEVRRQGRQLAAALGLETQDQIRVAAALSEAGRRLLALGRVTVVFALWIPDPDDPQVPERPVARALLGFQATVDAPTGEEFVGEIGLTRGLMDLWDVVRTSTTTSVGMARRVPDRALLLDDEELAEVCREIAASSAGTPLEELAEQNRQLLATLAEVQAHRDELLRLNGELEETNRGVVALYTELSDELEATNRGVVALHSELDQRTTQLREASEAKTRFLASVTHELRSPVTSITGLTRLLRDPQSDALSPDQSRQLELIDESSRSLLTLVNELLDLAKAESGRLQPVPQDTDLKPIFDTLRGTLRALPASPTTALVVEDPVGLPLVRTDPVMLAQVLRNLLTNALKFTPDGEVRLSAAVDDGHLVLTVTDTGIGIPPDEIDRVFEEFHQVRHALQATVTGTGLGLPYARRLVEALHGTLTLTSELHRGSTFTVRLPVGGLSGQAESRSATDVLLVDDDEAFRTAAGEVLRRCGFHVREAGDGRTALAVIAVHPPDLVLLDLRLAELDGFAVLDALHADERLREIPVVVITAYPSDVTEAAALRHTTTVLDKTSTTLDDLCDVVGLAARSPR